MKPRTVHKAMVVEELRSRQLHDRADWADRALPEIIDADKNASLLQMLGIDLDAVAALADVKASRA